MFFFFFETEWLDWWIRQDINFCLQILPGFEQLLETFGILGFVAALFLSLPPQQTLPDEFLQVPIYVDTGPLVSACAFPV